MKKVKFIVIGWRDTAYMTSSAEGAGDYNRPKVYTKDMSLEEIREMEETGFVDVNGTEICIDYETDSKIRIDDGDNIEYAYCTLFMNTTKYEDCLDDEEDKLFIDWEYDEDGNIIA